MFQFGRFPTHTYVFSMRFTVLHRECFHIRISAGRSLFAAHRSFSQLVTSFIGSWCQGIHLMLFFAWTFCKVSFARSLDFLELLEFLEHFFGLLILVKRFYPFAWIFTPPFGEIVILPKLERPIKFYFANLVKIICPLICSFLTLQYTLFGFQWAYIWNTLCFKCQVSLDGWTPSLCLRKAVKLDLSLEVSLRDLVADFYRLVGSSGLEPPTSRLSGARSNHLSYEPM